MEWGSNIRHREWTGKMGKYNLGKMMLSGCNFDVQVVLILYIAMANLTCHVNVQCKYITVFVQFWLKPFVWINGDITSVFSSNTGLRIVSKLDETVLLYLLLKYKYSHKKYSGHMLFFGANFNSCFLIIFSLFVLKLVCLCE